MAASPQRFIGLDIHKDYMVVAAVDKQQPVVLPAQRVHYAQLTTWCPQRLIPSDRLVLETGNDAWTLCDRLQPWVELVTVAHAAEVKLIAHSLIKTDKHDALVLARLLAADLIPAVWVPPLEVREPRVLLHHRRELVAQRSAVQTRLRAILNAHNLESPGDDVTAQRYRPWWDNWSLNSAERCVIRQDLALVDHLSAAIEAVERELASLSVSPSWCAQVACLLQLPGIGLLNAMTILSAIGEIERFARAKKLVGYAGLGASVHSSGQAHHGGHITKTGRVELRTVMIEAAWRAVRHDGRWRQPFEQLAQRLGRRKAITATARKLLVVVWHVLRHRQADREADPQAVAERFMRWAAAYGLVHSTGLQRTAFVRRELDRLGLGQSLTTLKFGGRLNSLPPPAHLPMP